MLQTTFTKRASLGNIASGRFERRTKQ